MVVIEKENNRKKVSRCSFENFFKNSGWHIVSDDVEIVNEQELEVETDDSENWDEVLNEDKSLNEMNRSELEEKASSLGVDISGCNTNKQIREKLKQYIK